MKSNVVASTKVMRGNELRMWYLYRYRILKNVTVAGIRLWRIELPIKPSQKLIPA